MSNHYRIIAANWQLKAAQEKRLGAVIVPLEPKPKPDGSLFYKNKKTLFGCLASASIPADQLSANSEIILLPFEEGDLIYLAERWCKGDWGDAFDDDIYFTESTTPEAENIGWQPAETMPPEAAAHWYKVTKVAVAQTDDISPFTAKKAGLIENSSSFLALLWNNAHPDQPWDSDRWVVVIEVEGIGC